MKSLSDRIEQYIRVLIERSETNEVEIQRIELAETFNCVPSQITYVIATRFTAEDGFRTISRRGGKGYIKIQKLQKVDHEEIKPVSLSEFNEYLQRPESGLTPGQVQKLQALAVRIASSPNADFCRGAVLQAIRIVKEG